MVSEFAIGLLIGVVGGVALFVAISVMTGTAPFAMRDSYKNCLADGGTIEHCVDKYILLKVRP